MRRNSRGLLNALSRRERKNGEQGQILILFTLVVVLLMALAAIVIDVGLLRTDGARLQNALDSGALAAAQKLPANSTNIANVRSTATNFTQGSFPGLAAPDTTFACLIGNNGTDLPRVTDMPAICNVSLLQNDAAWRCTGSVCWAPCNPSVTTTDVCNTVILKDSAVRNYSFGGAVGVNSGSTGTLVSAACTGACGGPPTVPVDVVVMLDRTGSMAGDEANLRSGARSVLTAFDPSLQRVALGFTGPSSQNQTCGSPAVSALAMSPGGTSAVTFRARTITSTAAAGAANLSIAKPATSTDDVLVAGITISSATANITAPIGWIPILVTRGTAVTTATFYKILVATEAGPYLFTFSASARASGFISGYRGVDLTHPIDVKGAATGSGNSVNVSAPGVTTTVANVLVVGVFGISSQSTFTQPSGWPERADQRVSNTSGPAIESADFQRNAAGSVAAQVAVASTTGTWAAHMFGLRPAPVETYGTDVNADMGQWVSVGFTGTDTDSPAVTNNQAYVNNATPPAVVNGTQIAQAINCFDLSGTGTNIARPMYMAAKYLADHGRPGVKKGIILETDGAPNNSGYGPASDYTDPGVIAAAQAAKDAGIEVYTIGYGVDNATIILLSKMATDSVAAGTNTTSCTTAENTDGDHLFCQPNGGDLSAVLRAAAVQLAGGSRLVQMYPQPVVTGVSPNGGPKAGGTTVTITGKYFTEAYSVSFGGTDAASFSVISDTQIRAVSPAGPASTTVDIQVSTPGGSSKIVLADHYVFGP